MSALVLQIIRFQQFCQFLFVSREKEYEQLGGWQGVCGRVARHLCSHHVWLWQCRAVGKSKYTQNTNFKIQKKYKQNKNKTQTSKKYKHLCSNHVWLWQCHAVGGLHKLQRKKEINYVYKWWSIELSLQGAESEGQWRHAFYQSRLVLKSSSKQNFGWF